MLLRDKLDAVIQEARFGDTTVALVLCEELINTNAPQGVIRHLCGLLSIKLYFRHLCLIIANY